MKNNKNAILIKDFGEFVPGCFKYHGAVSFESFEKMSEAEQRLKAKRANIWEPINAIQMVENGEDNVLVYIKTRIRRMAYALPKVHNFTNAVEEIKAYVKSLIELRDRVMSIKTEDELMDFCYTVTKLYPEWSKCVSLYKINNIKSNMQSYRNRVIALNFPYNTKGFNKGKKKISFKLEPLNGIARDGEDYRKGKDVKEKDWEDTFAFRGVVFGNSVTQKERQDDLNYGYDGFLDLAEALKISNADVSFGSRLNISFAARGRGSVAGHYEGINEVINMTRINGAGIFARLWFYALDDMLAKFCGITSGHTASGADDEEKKRLPASFNALIHALQFDDCNNQTSYKMGSCCFDSKFKKCSSRRWDSKEELAARAFACYLKDIIGTKSDYVIAHSDAYHWENEHEKLTAIPQGDERDIFNEMFEMLFTDLKEIGFLHHRTLEVPQEWLFSCNYKNCTKII